MTTDRTIRPGDPGGARPVQPSLAPRNEQELARRIAMHQHTFGRGIEGAGMSMACPWCGAPDWLEFLVIDGPIGKVATCGECGRAGLFRSEPIPGGHSHELVQTDGPDAPAWMKYPPRRGVP